ncbi:BrnT-like toxin [Mycobacterium phage Typha]|uniref:RelE-like toxin n=1 Tax=Mycobacterium phage Typha TaxID=2517971 RepID=A0A482J6Q7_9CAUD|nr:toxin [Mycobacterium phage Typha]QBP29697.1 BrnT-like toxin [Mycobacterium phage Typha]URM86484.1 BrnT-like toxin [Mycobacterium phage Hilltopfarm]
MSQFVKITRSARKHGVSKGRIRTAMRHANPTVVEAKGQVVFIGRDNRGTWLEVIARDGNRSPNELVVFHAMPLRWRPASHQR